MRSERLLDAMLHRIEHRGPDDQGLVTSGRATIGARRLSIIDLERGHQPMADESGDIVAVQNGELYNFPLLRDELLARGHRLVTRNDTEVLPHLYEECGSDLVVRLRGMFAIAVWDRRTSTLLLARDRFGKKPVVYAQLPDGGIAFASEIQALLAHPQVGREIDDDAIDEYLTLGYITAPRTAFLAIRKLPPGHVLRWHDGRVDVSRYWRLAFEPKTRLSFDEAAEELRDRIDEAVRIRLMSDVPLGAFLSGGLDSSTVVAFMAKHSERPVKTYSIGFADAAFDELSYAREVARAFSTEHHEFVVDPSATDVLPMLVRHLGEPMADSSIVPTYHVARITRSEVTVALNGDGGDELFAGYDRYKAAVISGALDRIPRPALHALSRAAGAVPVAAGLPRPIHRARRFLVSARLGAEERHLRWTGYFVGPLRDLILGERLRGRSSVVGDRLEEAAAVTGAATPFERYMASDVVSYLPFDLLVKVDIASMATSLEARSPLLDQELAEFVARLPARHKLSARRSKMLLRRAMRGILPERILERGKMGFTAPVGSWLRGPLREQFADVASSSVAARLGFVDGAAVQRLFEEHSSGAADRTTLLWSLLILDIWLRDVVDGAATHPTQASVVTIAS